MEPVRTCLGCRRRAPRSSLLRIVVCDGELTADPSAVLSGRGAWVHRTDGCLDTALSRKAFGRALRVPGIEADVTTLRRSLTNQSARVPWGSPREQAVQPREQLMSND
ncbi:YlxR family protein [Marisediminicola sp. LYQ85]|uniref:YlxR family protein n=1 Tax=Marisediminicola sp. LYQ85 TaxID=3391062 RepID=UPI0039837BB3